MAITDVAAMTISGEAVRLQRGQYPRAVCARGRTHIVASLDRGVVYNGQTAWRRGLRPPLWQPLMADAGAGNLDGVFRFCVRYKRDLGRVASVASPLAVTAGTSPVTSLELTDRSVEIEARQGTPLDPYDILEVLGQEANDGNWRVVAEWAGQTTGVIDLSDADWADKPLAFAGGRRTLDDSYPPAMDDAVVFQQRIASAGQDNLILDGNGLGTIHAANVWMPPDPFDETVVREDAGAFRYHVRRGVVILHPASEAILSGWPGSEMHRLLEIDDAQSREKTYVAGFPISDQALLLQEPYTDPDSMLADINLAGPTYYQELADDVIRWNLEKAWAQRDNPQGVAGAVGWPVALYAAEADGYPFPTALDGLTLTITRPNGKTYSLSVTGLLGQDPEDEDAWRGVTFTLDEWTELAAGDAWSFDIDGAASGTVGSVLRDPLRCDVVDAEGVAPTPACLQMEVVGGGANYVDLRAVQGSLGTGFEATASLWAGCGVRQTTPKTGVLRGRNHIAYSRLDDDVSGGNDEATPPDHLEQIAQIGTRMPRRLAVYADNLVVLTDEEAVLGAGGANPGLPLMFWGNRAATGIAARNSLVAMPEDCGRALAGDLIWASPEGVARLSSNGITNETTRLGLHELWNRLRSVVDSATGQSAQPGLRAATGGYHAKEGLYVLGNLRLARRRNAASAAPEIVDRHVALVWDLKNDQFLVVQGLAMSVQTELLDHAGRMRSLTLDDLGFASWGLDGELATRDAAAALASRAGCVLGNVLYDAATPTSGDGGALTSDMAGCWIQALRSDGRIESRRIRTVLDSRRAEVEDAWLAGADAEAVTYWMGGCAWAWQSGLLGDDWTLKSLEALRLRMDQRGYATSHVAVRIWKAAAGQDLDAVTATTPLVNKSLTRALTRGGAIWIPGDISAAYVLRVEGIAPETQTVSGLDLLPRTLRARVY